MKIILPDSVKRIIGILEENGYEAYAVGGCVRDSLLGKQPKDWDITTSAKPDQVKALFHRTIDTGIEHGTVTVMMHHEGYEVTTYRIDGKYEDGRHPKEVIFTPSLEEDLKYLEQNRYSISAERIQYYQQTMLPMLYVERQNVLYSGNQTAMTEISTLINQYIEGAIPRDRLIRELEGRIRLMQLEDEI